MPDPDVRLPGWAFRGLGGMPPCTRQTHTLLTNGQAHPTVTSGDKAEPGTNRGDAPETLSPKTESRVCRIRTIFLPLRHWGTQGWTVHGVTLPGLPFLAESAPSANITKASPPNGEGRLFRHPLYEGCLAPRNQMGGSQTSTHSKSP